MKKSEVNKFIIAAIGSAVSGAIIGLLFAPEKGSDTRKNISRTGDKYLKKIKDELEQIRKQLNKQTKFAKNGLNDLGVKARKLTSYDEWTKEELYERAKTNEIEGYSKMNKDELIDALKNH